MIIIDGEIGWDTTDRSFADALNMESGDVEIQINSGGGSVFHGISIFNAIKAYDKGTVTVTITSLAASIASYIALAADKVKAYDNAVYMIHNASVMAWGDHRELRKKAEILNGLTGIISKAYINKTGKAATEIEALMNDETFLYGAEMLANGFVDEIISTDEEKPKDQMLALANETFTSCLKASHDRVTENDYVQAAAMLKETPLEETAPVKDSTIEVDEFVMNKSRVNAIKTRLNLKGKL